MNPLLTQDRPEAQKHQPTPPATTVLSEIAQDQGQLGEVAQMILADRAWPPTEEVLTALSHAESLDLPPDVVECVKEEHVRSLLTTTLNTLHLALKNRGTSPEATKPTDTPITKEAKRLARRSYALLSSTTSYSADAYSPPYTPRPTASPREQWQVMVAEATPPPQKTEKP